MRVRIELMTFESFGLNGRHYLKLCSKYPYAQMWVKLPKQLCAAIIRKMVNMQCF